MVSHRDLIMYLVAVKSFYRKVGEGEIVILDDGTLTAGDRGILSYHLGSPHFIDVAGISHGAFPKGGCWERLLTILDMLENHYVIQLDSDTVTRSDVPEVIECILSNRCFALGTRSQFGTKIVSVTDASNIARDFRDPHVQNAAEKNLAQLPHPESKRYVRGSAGFAGFARGVQFRSLADEFSARMFELIGAKWAEWGSEQVMSNYLIANTPSAVVLPHPKYTCFGPTQSPGQASFLHFIGSYRYMQGVYARESKAVIRSQLGGLSPDFKAIRQCSWTI